MHWDLIVLGGGPAGYVGAAHAAKCGLNTLLIEENALGGVCLNEGCIPSKTLLHAAKLADGANHGAKYGVIGQAAIDHAAVLKRKDKVVRTLAAGIRQQMKTAGVAVLNAHGQLSGRDAQGHVRILAGAEEHTARYLLLATGSSAALPPIPGLDEALANGFAITSREALSLPEIPSRLVVVGGGVIGMELASYYQSAGSRVSVVELLPRIGGALDEEIADNLMKNYARKGMAFHTNARVCAIGAGDVLLQRDGRQSSLPADRVLVAVGRAPRTQGLGLETLGVETRRGAVIADDCGRTNIPDVFAAGDVNGRAMLAHVASREAEAAVNTMLGREDSVNQDAVPAVLYTHPEVAAVGLTLAQALERGLDADQVKISLRYSGRYLAENEGGDGFALLIYEKHTRRALGAHIIGSYASEIIGLMSLLISRFASIDELLNTILPHPTVGEIFREAVLMAQ